MKNILRALSLSIILFTLHQVPSAMAQAAAPNPAMDKFKEDMKTDRKSTRLNSSH